MLFTDRRDGNLSGVGGDGHEHGTEARAALRERLGLAALARGYQVHGSRVHLVREIPAPDRGQRPEPDADGQATALRGVGAMVLAADCMPVAIGGQGTLAMVHAGWRGLAAGVLERGVDAVRELGEDGELVAVIGPCAGPCCYEVGPEVHAALHTGATGKATLDMPTIARTRLAAAGATSVTALGGCTICDERFFSYRREGERAGRQAGVAWLS
ncbi:MAG TPA: polyphenol oxidase family protein [Solirubrobacteraceae bacterium]|nr:polyphenol oxidase family protein [Solirubrobacteraceae bacterium]